MSRAKKIWEIGYRVIKILITSTIKRVEDYVDEIMKALEESEKDE
jgi:very-short-patch-repair endonuclease